MEDKIDKASTGITSARLILNDNEVTNAQGKTLQQKLLKADKILTTASASVTAAKTTVNEMMSELPWPTKDAENEQERKSTADAVDDDKDGSDISDDEEQPKTQRDASKRNMEDATPQLGETTRKQPKTEQKTGDLSSKANGDTDADAPLPAPPHTPNAAPSTVPNAAPAPIQHAVLPPVQDAAPPPSHVDAQPLRHEIASPPTQDIVHSAARPPTTDGIPAPSPTTNATGCPNLTTPAEKNKTPVARKNEGKPSDDARPRNDKKHTTRGDRSSNRSVVSAKCDPTNVAACVNVWR
ncbi:hypothetical protein AAVH_26476 [Aphelenchoides avenae]|nr:hypothetical protein AAVH_26476 [Aphelenchus avenae]